MVVVTSSYATLAGEGFSNIRMKNFLKCIIREIIQLNCTQLVMLTLGEVSRLCLAEGLTEY